MLRLLVLACVLSACAPVGRGVYGDGTRAGEELATITRPGAWLVAPASYPVFLEVDGQEVQAYHCGDSALPLVRVHPGRHVVTLVYHYRWYDFVNTHRECSRPMRFELHAEPGHVYDVVRDGSVPSPLALRLEVRDRATGAVVATPERTAGEGS